MFKRASRLATKSRNACLSDRYLNQAREPLNTLLLPCLFPFINPEGTGCQQFFQYVVVFF